MALLVQDSSNYPYHSGWIQQFDGILNRECTLRELIDDVNHIDNDTKGVIFILYDRHTNEDGEIESRSIVLKYDGYYCDTTRANEILDRKVKSVKGSHNGYSVTNYLVYLD